jgi:hypothetical protein
MDLLEMIWPGRDRDDWSRRARRAFDRLPDRLSHLPDRLPARADLPSASELWRRVRVSEPLPLAVAAAIVGTIGGLVSAAALGLVARFEGRRPLQPINATSHWLHGETAGDVQEADLAHTGVGFATHQLSAMFWAVPYAWWLGSRDDRTPAEIAGGAAAVAGIAAVVDYGLMPRRATPGWEHALPARSVAVGFGALAVGLAAGGLLTEALRRR